MRQKLFFIFAITVALALHSCAGGNEKKAVAVPVEVYVVEEDALPDAVGYSGTIEATTASSLSFGSAGTLATLLVKEGMLVGAGQLLATLDGTAQQNMLLSAEAAYAMSASSLRQAEDAYARMEQLHTAGSLSDVQWIDVETKLAQAQAAAQAAAAQVAIAEKGVADTRLTAPFAGYISSRSADVGQQVAPGVPIVTLVNIEQVKAKITVPEQEIAAMKVGDTLSVRVASLRATPFVGRISECAVSADALSRSYGVWVLIDNKEHRLLPGMLCEVRAATTAAEAAVAIPAQHILIDFDNRRYVWAVRGGKATQQYISTGATVGNRVVVTAGLSLGDSIVGEGRQKVWEGMPL